MPKFKKIIILDAGGVIHPDSGFDLPNQVELANLTQLSSSEIKKYQDHRALNIGEQSLSEALTMVAQASRGINNIEILLHSYKKGIALYPDVPEWIDELYKANYQVVICTNNSDLGIEHTRELLAKVNLSCVKVYGSAELHLSKPHPDIFLKVCESEKVAPDECWFVDDRVKNHKTAELLGIGVISFEQPISLKNAAQSINNCRKTFLELGII